jgi:hypothetical protein
MSTLSTERFFYDRAYLWLLLAPLVTFLGFFPSYFGQFASTGLGHHIHGATATLWMLLLVTQPLLYARNMMRMHRIMGRFSMLLVPVLIITAIVMVHKMMTGGQYPPMLAYQLGFIDFFVLTQFLVFYVLAIKNVKRTEYHARWMVSTVFGPLIPAVTRLLFWMFAVPGFALALNIAYGLTEIALLILIFNEYRRGVKNHVYPIVLVVMAVQHVLMNVAADWAWWQSFMDWVGHF